MQGQRQGQRPSLQGPGQGQELDLQGQGQGQGPSLQGPGQGQEQGLTSLSYALLSRSHKSGNQFCSVICIVYTFSHGNLCLLQF